MKRQAGIIFSAIVLILGSLLELLFALGAVAAGFVEHSQFGSRGDMAARAGAPIPGWLPVFMYGFSAVFVALAVWGIVTSIGLFRLRRWARYSVLVIGGTLAVLGLPGALMMLVLAAVPLPLPSSIDSSQVHSVQTVTRVMFGVIAAGYGIVSAIGISWLVYFNRKKVREVFAGAPDQVIESRRPLLISVIAVFSMIGGVSCLLIALLPFPGAVFGFILHGWVRAAVYLVIAALMLAGGVGLWRLEEWGRRLALALQVVGLAQYAVFLVRPSLMTNYTAELNQTMNLAQPPMTAPLQTLMYEVSFGFGTVLIIAVLWILIHYRGTFQHPAAPAQIESPA